MERWCCGLSCKQPCPCRARQVEDLRVGRIAPPEPLFKDSPEYVSPPAPDVAPPSPSHPLQDMLAQGTAPAAHGAAGLSRGADQSAVANGSSLVPGPVQQGDGAGDVLLLGTPRALASSTSTVMAR